MRTILLSACALLALLPAALAKDIAGTPSDDMLNATEEADRIDAGGGHDEILGRAGDDVLHGGEGNDELFGGDGDDVLDGGPGNDRLDGRGGDDELTGGAGRDYFFYYARVDNGADTITDFDGAEDTILFDGFATADVEVRAEAGDTIVDLGEHGRITVSGVDGLDEDDLAFR